MKFRIPLDNLMVRDVDGGFRSKSTKFALYNSETRYTLVTLCFIEFLSPCRPCRAVEYA